MLPTVIHVHISTINTYYIAIIIVLSFTLAFALQNFGGVDSLTICPRGHSYNIPLDVVPHTTQQRDSVNISVTLI